MTPGEGTRPPWVGPYPESLAEIRLRIAGYDKTLVAVFEREEIAATLVARTERVIPMSERHHCESKRCSATLADDDSCSCACEACKAEAPKPLRLWSRGYWYVADDEWCILQKGAKIFNAEERQELARVLDKYPKAWPIAVRTEGEPPRHCRHPVDCMLYNSRQSDDVPCNCGCPDCLDVNHSHEGNTL